jgi:hypothetical protein
MSDDKTRRNPEDNKQVDINDPKEIANWCKSFRCSEGDLRAAVMAVGKSANALREYFDK